MKFKPTHRVIKGDFKGLDLEATKLIGRVFIGLSPHNKYCAVMCDEIEEIISAKDISHAIDRSPFSIESKCMFGDDLVTIKDTIFGTDMVVVYNWTTGEQSVVPLIDLTSSDKEEE